MEFLRGRCTSPPPKHGRDEGLPLVHPKGRRLYSGGRSGRHGGGHGGGSGRHQHHPGASLRRHSMRLLLAAMAIVVAVRVSTHLLSAPEPQLEDLMRLYGDGPAAGSEAGGRSAAAAADAATPKLIPRIIHQTHPGGAAPTALLPLMASWRRLNPGWEVRLYDDQDCLDFVRREFPEYLEAYRRLGKPAERADFFRYMAVLRHGGVYADVDAECRRPLDAVLHSKDTLVAGWDNEFADPRAALEAGYVRMRQLVQWVFAGAPGHPALRELCDRIAAGVGSHESFSLDSRLNTLERTGAGLFTDVVLRHAEAHPPARREDPWGVRLLPRVLFGAPHREPAFGLSPDDAGVAVLHHAGAAGGWGKSMASSWAWQVQDVTSEVARRWRHRSEDAWEEEAKIMAQRDAALRLYPVSVDFDPPFDLLTHRVGRGERQSGADVGAAVTTHGSWQPSVQPSRRPSLIDAVVGSMGGADSRQNVLVDVGAGYGLLSLAAAARGHRVHAFELGPASLAALEASLARNGFEHLVHVHKEPLGSLEQEGYTCMLPRQASSSSSSSGTPGGTDLEVQRGYGPAAVHGMPAEACQLLVRRAAGATAVPEADRVAALRISANGWEGHILQGFAPLLERPDRRPPVIAVEWNPTAMKAAGWKRPLKLVEWLHSLGYADVSHSGYICDERWYSITYGIRRRGGIKPEDLAGLRQPTWCRLLPQHFSLLQDRFGGQAGSGSAYPETLLFVNREAGRASNATAAGRAGGHGGSSSDSGGSGGGDGMDEFGVPDAVAQALAAAAEMVASVGADAAANQTAAALAAAGSGDGSKSSSRSGSSKGSQTGPQAASAAAAQQQPQQQQQQDRNPRNEPQKVPKQTQQRQQPSRQEGAER